MGYVGSAPAGVQLTGSDAVFVFTASGGETSVTTADSGASVVYEPGFVSVFVNGVRFVEGDDYTASTGSGVSLTSALNGGDVVVVVASDTRALDDAVPRSGGSFAGGVEFLGGLDSTTVTASGDITSNGETVFHRGNVVGTVSESGGTPTGAVVERGSNANGSYVRYADGTQICFRFFEPSFGATTSFSSLGLSGKISDSSISWTYPVPFTTNSFPQVSATRVDRTCLVLTENATTSTTEADGFYVLVNSNLSAGFHPEVSFLLVGRWY